MLLNVSKVDLWSAIIPDQPGSIAAKLEGLAKAGANLDFISSWRNPDTPDASEIVVSPLEGEKQLAAASALGLRRNDAARTIRIEGPDEPGMGYRVTRALALEGLNLKGMTAASHGNGVVMYVALDTPADADRAVKVLQRSM